MEWEESSSHPTSSEKVGDHAKRGDPRFSVLEADLEHFPDNVLVITEERDRLVPEAKNWVRKLQGADTGKKRI